MKVFEHPNLADFTCPICGKADDKPVVLIGVSGTEDNEIMEARQFHVDCIELTSYKLVFGQTFIGMVIEEVDE